MTFLNIVLDPPAYGWRNASGELSKPTTGQIWKEFFSRLNIFKTRKNWLPFMAWAKVILSIPFLALFIF